MRMTILFILAIVSIRTNGQDKVWKKRVSRMIDVRDLRETGQNTHKILSGALLRSVKTGKVSAYTAFDNNFTTKMTHEEFAIRCENIDTLTMRDPVNDSLIILVTDKTVRPDSVYQYRIFEEWNFDPDSGKFMIQIKYVAPLRNVYSNDGVFRGKQPLFWISYNDFSSAMEVTDIMLVQLFYRFLWQSYFDLRTDSVDGYLNSKTGLWAGNATSILDMNTEDTVKHFLRDENNDTLLSELIITAVKNGAVPAWSGYDEFLSPQLSVSEIADLISTKVDTVFSLPVTGNEQAFSAAHSKFDYSTSHSYFLSQNWSFNSILGKTEIRIRTIAPVMDIYDEEGALITTKPLLWCRYTDLLPILNKAAQYHPTNTFAMHIWNSYFLSDKKPELQK